MRLTEVFDQIFKVSNCRRPGADAIGIEISIRYATIMVATVPILLVYPFIQKYFTKGVMIGAVKE